MNSVCSPSWKLISDHFNDHSQIFLGSTNIIIKDALSNPFDVLSVYLQAGNYSTL